MFMNEVMNYNKGYLSGFFFPLLLTPAPALVRKQRIPLLQAAWSPDFKGNPGRKKLCKEVAQDKEDERSITNADF